MKLTDAQQHAIQRLAGKTMFCDFDRTEKQWYHLPFDREVKTYSSLEAKGLVIYHSVDMTGISRNGYRLTDEGRKLVK